jgi:hypothetical protein
MQNLHIERLTTSRHIDKAVVGLFNFRLMIKAILPQRHNDAWGCGDFGAPRGSHTHRGVDYCCYPDTAIQSHVTGKVTKLGYPYSDDYSFRYVEVTDDANLRHRFFYVKPGVEVGDEITEGMTLGWSQDISGRYRDPKKAPMLNHCHYEVLSVDGLPINPEELA